MSLLDTDLSILWPALIAGLLVAVSHVPLGQQVLARGIVFIDLAIAQVAGLGVIAASGFGLPITVAVFGVTKLRSMPSRFAFSESSPGSMPPKR